MVLRHGSAFRGSVLRLPRKRARGPPPGSFAAAVMAPLLGSDLVDSGTAVRIEPDTLVVIANAIHRSNPEIEFELPKPVEAVMGLMLPDSQLFDARGR